MKQLTCSALGGPCDVVITGNTADEMMTNGMAHVTAAHPEMVAGIQNMPKEEMDKWNADFHAKWDAAPEMEVAPAADATPTV